MKKEGNILDFVGSCQTNQQITLSSNQKRLAISVCYALVGTWIIRLDSVP